MFLDSGDKAECFGCEGCAQSCSRGAIFMEEDGEGFRYPQIDLLKCTTCGICREVCPFEHAPEKHIEDRYVFGGWHCSPETRFESTSGGAFSAIVDAFCDENYAIFGAEARALQVFHSYVTDKSRIGKFRKSKYSQSMIGLTYRKAREFLNNGCKVLFSGTPCQIAGLLSFLKEAHTDTEKLLTVEVVCEGVPSPLYIRKLDKEMKRKYGVGICSLDYRYTGKSVLFHGKWDFEKMKIVLEDKKKILKKDRWLNPFWSIWLEHLMSRPSCYECSFATQERIADISLADLWGVHLYCPDLYGQNKGSSLIIANTEKGREVVGKAQHFMYGHELRFEDAVKYQGPLRKNIDCNPNREIFMRDLESNMTYKEINKKWTKKVPFKLLWQKYVWGNRQRIVFWKLTKGRYKIK